MIEGFVIAGLAGLAMAAFAVAFWDEIKNWLNSVAADAVEKVFGYSARNHIQKAVAVLDKVMNKVKNVSRVYTKRNPAATYFDKVTITAEADVADISEDMLKEFEKHNNRLTQVFEYKR